MTKKIHVATSPMPDSILNSKEDASADLTEHQLFLMLEKTNAKMKQKEPLSLTEQNLITIFDAIENPPPPSQKLLDLKQHQVNWKK